MATFRSTARTVDLLGRQQIAGIPTAVHELFKNAHDAYADHVEVDFFKEDNLFVLRDDGLGMTRTEFEERWLVVGTDSKLKKNSKNLPPVDLKKSQRPILGEKGIGRLATGIIGHQVLIVSRAERDNKLCPFVVAFINWEVFSIPGLDLYDIPVPIKEITNIDELSSCDVVTELCAEYSAFLKVLLNDSRIDIETYNEIFSNVEKFRFSLTQMEPFLPGSESLKICTLENRGTQFWVFPVNETIYADLQTPLDKSASRIERELLGFSDQMDCGLEDIQLKTAFRFHYSDNDYVDVIESTNFFVKDDFRNADHHLVGRFDEYGQFKGKISVYGEESEINIGRTNLLKKTSCGSFSFRLAYVQGDKRETTLPDAEWYSFNEKCKKVGGVYVYMNGVRVLPYGAPDFDWLHIELERSKNLRAFFSYRRMCAAVLLDSSANSMLSEKAGREGFIRNNAFNQMQLMLKALLDEIANTFFKQGTLESQAWESKKLQLRKLNIANEKRKERQSKKQSELKSKLKSFFQSIELGHPKAELDALNTEFVRAKHLLLFSETGIVKEQVVELESTIKKDFRKIKAKYRLQLPDIGVSASLQKDLLIYENYSKELQSDLFLPFEINMRNAFEQLFAQTFEQQNKYQRIQEIIKQHGNTARKDMDELYKKIDEKLLHTNRDFTKSMQDWYFQQVENLKEYIYNTSRELDIASEAQSVYPIESKILDEIDLIKEDVFRGLKSVDEQLSSLSIGSDDNFLIQIQALEQQEMDLMARLDDEMEVAQLGMAVEIISHELEHNIRVIRNYLKDLSAWGKANEDLNTLYLGIRNSFEHLDGFLTLFTPLQRRLYRNAISFSGEDVYVYLFRLFSQKLQDNNFILDRTNEFGSFIINGYPSVYYPVFTNLVDNSIYWMSQKMSGNIILLGVLNENSLYVEDHGPGVNAEHRSMVFEKRFSLKPSGRGLGLTISRESMRKIGGDLSIGEIDSGARFVITLPKPINKEEK